MEDKVLQNYLGKCMCSIIPLWTKYYANRLGLLVRLQMVLE